VFDMVGLEISEGANVNILKACQSAFARPQTVRFKQDLRAGTVVVSDTQATAPRVRSSRSGFSPTPRSLAAHRGAVAGP
jgi:hypothetical protein